MVRVSSTEFGKEIGRYQDLALSDAVIVTRHGRDLTVMISADEYIRLKSRDTQVLANGYLPDDIFEAVKDAKMGDQHTHLNDLIKDWMP
jgi:PHD/YefM family antitoxin component YafN of YafNO toxin-antitoxin module